MDRPFLQLASSHPPMRGYLRSDWSQCGPLESVTPLAGGVRIKTVKLMFLSLSSLRTASVAGQGGANRTITTQPITYV